MKTIKMVPSYSERVARCAGLMKTAGLDVLLLAKPANMAYLTGDGRLCAYAMITNEGKVALGVPSTDVEDVKRLACFDRLAGFEDEVGMIHSIAHDFKHFEIQEGSVGLEYTFLTHAMMHMLTHPHGNLTGDNILFSNDAFGQHYASEYMFNDLVDQSELMAECIKYYANILTPFSELVTKKIQEVLAFNLPVEIICTSHGVIWRDNPVQIVQQYLKWADNYREDQITLVYDTMWNGTRVMAENIARGIKQNDPQVNLNSTTWPNRTGTT